MGCEAAAIEVFEETRKNAQSLQQEGLTWYAAGKASNAGGVAVSGVSDRRNR